jgi:uncharacterized protein (TIGR02145 family)
MRNLIPILLAVVVLSSGCDPDGYSCNSEGCYADDDSPQYQTLEDCLSVCDEITPTPENCGDLVSHEGYDYSTVLIGDQCWFSENCRYLPEVSPSSEGSNTDPYYYVYDYQGTDVGAAQSTSNYETYGVLYNWPAVVTEGICPSGWHIPTDGEWQTMEISLGMSEAEAASDGSRGSPVGDYMKSTSGWDNGVNGSNSSGFTGLPGGYRKASGFDAVRDNAPWWSSTSVGIDNQGNGFSWQRRLDPEEDYVHRDGKYHLFGLSARCVRD